MKRETYQCMLPKYYWICGIPMEHEILTRSYTLRENCLSLFQQLTLTNNFTTRVGILCPFPLFVLRFGLAWVCTNCHNCCELMYTSVLLCSENNVTYSFHSLWPLHTLSIPLPFGGCFVQIWPLFVMDLLDNVLKAHFILWGTQKGSKVTFRRSTVMRRSNVNSGEKGDIDR